MDAAKAELLAESLENGLQLFKGNESTTTTLPSRETLVALKERVKSDAGKGW